MKILTSNRSNKKTISGFRFLVLGFLFMMAKATFAFDCIENPEISSVPSTSLTIGSKIIQIEPKNDKSWLREARISLVADGYSSVSVDAYYSPSRKYVLIETCESFGEEEKSVTKYEYYNSVGKLLWSGAVTNGFYHVLGVSNTGILLLVEATKDELAIMKVQGGELRRIVVLPSEVLKQRYFYDKELDCLVVQKRGDGRIKCFDFTNGIQDTFKCGLTENVADLLYGKKLLLYDMKNQTYSLSDGNKNIWEKRFPNCAYVCRYKGGVLLRNTRDWEVVYLCGYDGTTKTIKVPGLKPNRVISIDDNGEILYQIIGDKNKKKFKLVSRYGNSTCEKEVTVDVEAGICFQKVGEEVFIINGPALGIIKARN